MKRLLKIGVIVAVVVFALAELIRPNFVDPPIVPGETLEDSAAVPPDIQMLLSTSCSDCHTNKTTYPWYVKVTPVNWYLANHINEGRRHLNFSVWNTYDKKKKGKKLEEVCEQLDAGEMPLPSYLWIHHDAKLSDDQKKALCDWAKAEGAKVAAAQ